MAWGADLNLLSDQKEAAEHTGSDARLLAGPGTGKTHTLIGRICYLVFELNVSLENILVITFTRATTQDLRSRVKEKLGEENNLQIATLHSFALEQLLRNAKRGTELPLPLRVADDWEERHIIFEDLKSILSLNRIAEVETLFNELSADWQSLAADEEDWDIDPKFLGAWKNHRKIYGYTLRSEFVYQLKRIFEQHKDIKFKDDIKYLIVDEYQDLNCCDLYVIRKINRHGAELFVAGDDDQSIYGFRKAHPQGIRDFHNDYPGGRDFFLETCMRCDKNILDLGLFVAEQDADRIPKPINSRWDGGEVKLLNFGNQYREAEGIAKICVHLMERYKKNDILILLRSDHNGMYSRPIREALEKEGIPVAGGHAKSPLDEKEGREFFSFMKLALDREDSLAWRALIQLRRNKVGKQGIREIYKVAQSRGITFAKAIAFLQSDSSVLPVGWQSKILGAIQDVLDKLSILSIGELGALHTSHDDLIEIIRVAVDALIEDEEKREPVLLEFDRIAKEMNLISVEDIIRSVGVRDAKDEQVLEGGKINILTMHKAKGLTAEAVIVAACEQEHIPGAGRSEDEMAEERRLLYVSLTRAKHHLFVTYCDERIKQQQHTGDGSVSRRLTSFLNDAPRNRPKNGATFIRSLARENE